MSHAHAPGYRPAAASPVGNPDTWDSGIRTVARLLQGEDGVPDLTPREKEFLYDLAREEARYPMPTVRKIAALSRRARSAAARDAFAELIRAESTPLDQVAPVPVAFDAETAATGPADEAADLLWRDRTKPAAIRLIDTLRSQLHATRQAIDTLVCRKGQFA